MVGTFIKICQEIEFFLKPYKNVIALHMEPLSMFIILFQYIATGKTEVSDENFIQIDKTNFLSNA